MIYKYKKFNFLLVIVFILLASAFVYLSNKVKSSEEITTPETKETTEERKSESTVKNPNVTVTQDTKKRTISDTTNKYKVSYPVNWDQRIGNPNQFFNFDLEEYKDKEFDPEKDTDKINVQIWTTDSKGKSLEDFILEKKSLVYKGKNIQFDEIDLGGSKALSHIEDFDQNYKTLIIYAQNPKTNNFQTITASPRYDLNKKEVDSILNTFEYID